MSRSLMIHFIQDIAEMQHPVNFERDILTCQGVVFQKLKFMKIAVCYSQRNPVIIIPLNLQGNCGLIGQIIYCDMLSSAEARMECKYQIILK